MQIALLEVLVVIIRLALTVSVTWSGIVCDREMITESDRFAITDAWLSSGPKLGG